MKLLRTRVPDIAANGIQNHLSDAKKNAKEENTICTEDVGPLFYHELVTAKPSGLISKTSLRGIPRKTQGVQREPEKDAKTSVCELRNEINPNERSTNLFTPVLACKR